MADHHRSPSPPNATLSRRALLGRVLRGTAAIGVLTSVGAIAAVRTGSYTTDPAREARLRFLTPWQLIVIDAVAARMCASDVPYDSPGAPPTPLEVEVGLFVDGFFADCSAPQQRDGRALIGFVEHVWPLACGRTRRFSALDDAARDDVLAQMEASSLDLVRGAFAALKSLLFMGYYRDPRTWGVIGYDGPLIDRPSKGWTPRRYLVRGGRAP